jgi:acetylornithine/N-succinyldiaminopimelate aminotransferase
VTDNAAKIETGADGVDGAEKDPRAALWPNYSPPRDLVFSHGIGSELFTEDGVAYLDFLSGIAVTSFGHAHPHLVDALTGQANKLWHLSNVFRIPAAEELARRIVANSFADSLFFANSGTEAVEAGLKAMRGYHAAKGNTQRTRIIGFNDSFHGRSMAALAAAGNQSHMQNFIPGDYGFDHVAWEDIAALKAAIGPETAGIILEPIQGEGGIRPINKEFLEAVRNLCDEQDLLLMFDEVQCGVGRSGHLFAHENFAVLPDVMALAKGLGGGFPIGVCLTTKAVADPMIVGTHGSTFGGNPLAAAVGNAVLDLVLDKTLLGGVKAKGQFLQQALEGLVAKHPEKIESVHGLGLMLGLKCTVPCADLLVALRNNQLLVGKSGSNMIRLLPPLNVSQEHIEKAVSVIDATLAGM